MSFNDLLLIAKSGRYHSGTSPAADFSDGSLSKSTPMFNNPTSSSLLDDDKLLSDDFLKWSRSKRDQEDEFLHLEHFEDFATKIKASIKADEAQKKGKMNPPRTILDDPEFIEEYPKPPPPKPKIMAPRNENAQSNRESVKRRLFIDGDDDDDIDDDDKEVEIRTTNSLRVSEDSSELERLRRENSALREENAMLKCMLMDSDIYKFGLKSLSTVVREMHVKMSDKSHSKEDIDSPFSLLNFLDESSKSDDEITQETTFPLNITKREYKNGSTKEFLPGGFTALKMKNGDSYMSYPSGKKVFTDNSGIKITDTEIGTKEICNPKTGQYECYTKGMLHEAYFEDTSYVVEKKDEFCVSVKSLSYPLVTIESPEGISILIQPNGNVSITKK